MNGSFWDDKYTAVDGLYGDAPNAFLASQAHQLDGLETAFVPADGEGRNGVWLAEQGLRVTTMDLSAVGVAHARRLAERRGVAIDARQGDLATWDWPAEPVWDCVVCVWVHLPQPLRSEVHRALWHGLRPGGLVILEAYRPTQVEFRERYGTRGGPPSPERMMTQDDLRADFFTAASNIGANPSSYRGVVDRADTGTVPDFAGGEFELLEDADVELDEGAGHRGRSAVVRARIRKS